MSKISLVAEIVWARTIADLVAQKEDIKKHQFRVVLSVRVLQGSMKKVMRSVFFVPKNSGVVLNVLKIAVLLVWTLLILELENSPVLPVAVKIPQPWLGVSRAQLCASSALQIEILL